MKVQRTLIAVILASFFAVNVYAGEGPGSAGGGEIERDDQPAEMLVEAAVERAKEMLPYVLNYFELQYKAYPKGMGIQRTDLNQVASIMFDHSAEEDVFAVLARSKFVALKEICLDPSGDAKDGSVGFLEAGKVCFSIPRIREKTTEQDVFRKVLALAAHEMVHRMGGNETQARLFAAHVRSYFKFTDVLEYASEMRTEYVTRLRDFNSAMRVIVTAIELKQSTDRAIDMSRLCGAINQLRRGLKKPEIYTHTSGRMGMSPVRADIARTSFLLEEKYDIDDLLCTQDAQRLGVVQSWFGSAKTLTSTEFANARHLGFDADASGVFRKPELYNLETLAAEYSDLANLSDQILRSQAK